MPSSPEWSESKAWNTRSTQACHSSLSCTARQSSMAATQLSYLQGTLQDRSQMAASTVASTDATVKQIWQDQLSYLQGNLSRDSGATHIY